MVTSVLDKPSLALRDVTVHFGLRPILDRVSWEVTEGERVAVIGPNGVGKTTLLKLLAGALSPQEGEVLVEGQVRRSSAETELQIRQKVTYIPDELWYPWQRTAREFLTGIAELYGVPYRRRIEHIPRLLDLFGLTSIADSPLQTFSTGQLKKTSLCAGLVTETPILLLDEPFSGGLDPSGILAFKQVLKAFGRERSKTVVFSTPVPEIVDEAADRILVIHRADHLGTYRVTDIRSQNPHLSFPEALQKLIFPEATSQIENYFTMARDGGN